jgi:hypothetical protein
VLAGTTLRLRPEQLRVLLGDQLPSLDVVEHDDLRCTSLEVELLKVKTIEIR